MAVQNEILEFVQKVVAAMGLDLRASLEDTPDGWRVNLEGEHSGPLLRRGAEGLQALQHVASTAFRRQLGDDTRVVVDCNGYRREKDAELRQMARFLAEKVRASGAPQEIGPLNPYERRVVHLTVSELGDIASESIGDAFQKTVIISRK